MARYNPRTGQFTRPRARPPIRPKPAITRWQQPNWSGWGRGGGQVAAPGPRAIPEPREVFHPAVTPDYGSIISGLMGQTRADLAAQGIASAAERAAATQRGLIQFGGIPDLPGYGYMGDITDETRRLAAENTRAGLSTTARLNKAHTDAIANIQAQLAARGALQSGLLGEQLGEEQQQFTTGQYDARQQLLDYIAGVQSAFVESENRRREQELAALNAYTQQALAQNPATPEYTETVGPYDRLFPLPQIRISGRAVRPPARNRPRASSRTIRRGR